MPKPLVLWGGVDISSSLYDEKPLKYTQQPNFGRDKLEVSAYHHAVEELTPIVGVCRGAQLLCVLNGGKLYQHSEPYTQNHSIATLNGQVIGQVAADHHQIMIPKGHFITYAWNPAPTKVWTTDDNCQWKDTCAEVVYFPTTKSLAIQPHPEWMSSGHPFVKYVNELMEELNINFKF